MLKPDLSSQDVLENPIGPSPSPPSALPFQESELIKSALRQNVPLLQTPPLSRVFGMPQNAHLGQDAVVARNRHPTLLSHISAADHKARFPKSRPNYESSYNP